MQKVKQKYLTQKKKFNKRKQKKNHTRKNKTGGVGERNFINRQLREHLQKMNINDDMLNFINSKIRTKLNFEKLKKFVKIITIVRKIADTYIPPPPRGSNDEVLIKITPSLGFLIDDKFHNCDEEYDDEIDDWVEARHNLNCEIMRVEPDHLARVLSGEWFKGTPHEIKGGGTWEIGEGEALFDFIKKLNDSEFNKLYNILIRWENNDGEHVKFERNDLPYWGKIGTFTIE